MASCTRRCLRRSCRPRAMNPSCRLWRLPAGTGFTPLESMQGRLIRGHSCSARKALVCCDATLGEECGSEHGIQRARKLKDQCCECRCKAAVARAKRALRREMATFPCEPRASPVRPAPRPHEGPPSGLRHSVTQSQFTCHEQRLQKRIN